MLTLLLTACQEASPRHPPVQAAVLDGVASGEIGEGAGDLEDAIEGAGGEAELFEGAVEEAAAGWIDHAVTAQLLGTHARVDRSGRGRAEALDLDGPRRCHPPRHRLRRFAHRAAQLF